MRLFNFSLDTRLGLGVRSVDGVLRGFLESDKQFPGTLDVLLARGREAITEAGKALETAPVINPRALRFEPPVMRPPKILCVGLNYATHGAEVGLSSPDYPTIFTRFSSGLVGHGEPMVRPRLSTQFDYEGELAVIIGTGGRNISVDNALAHIAGYSVFNDGSLRDYQTKTSQWTMGKNFDATAAFGPDLVTPDELPIGGAGIRLTTRLNGEVVQDATTSDFLFDVPTLIATISAVMTLEPGDVIATGTPSGVGVARKPPLFMRPGDICEIDIEGVGLLSNTIVDEGDAAMGASKARHA